MKDGLKRWLVKESIKFLKVALCVLSSAFYSLCFAAACSYAGDLVSQGEMSSRMLCAVALTMLMFGIGAVYAAVKTIMIFWR